MVTAVARPHVAPTSRGVVGRVVRGARTTPGRLAVVGVLLVLLSLLAGLFAFAAVRERSQAAERVATRSEPLGVRTQELYRALAEADAAAAAGLLSGGVEKKELREDYERSLETAQRALMSASSAGASGPVAELLSRLSVEIPKYREDVAWAKSATRQGHPVGSAYLRAASRQMERVILPAAAELHEIAAGRLRDDHREATAVPLAAYLCGGFALGALVVAQVMLARRTKRIINPGLFLASLAVAASLAWLTTGLSTARSELTASRDEGWRPVDALSDARFAVLKARAAEGQILVQQGSDGGAYKEALDEQFRLLQAPGADGLLSEAERLSRDDDLATGRIADARAAVADWRASNANVMNQFNQTNFKGAVALVINDDGSSQVAFARAEKALSEAIAKDQADFEKAAARGRDAMEGLAVGLLVLAAVAAAAIVDGVRRRLGEYR
ncbi:hypothetical protein [Yinghuangia sp. YIM S09857]|uniref:hypothetical protein n=1 Tax=Yinghuangia sp. YIM S09857 TaxID=3436929 RepID=UPI003F53CCE3